MRIAATYGMGTSGVSRRSGSETRQLRIAADYHRARAARERQLHRRRIVGRVALVVLALSLTAAAVLPAIAASTEANTPMRTTLIKIQEGDTLWGIAAGHSPIGTPTSAAVRLIREMNDLDGSQVSAGMLLVVPAETSPQVASR